MDRDQFHPENTVLYSLVNGQRILLHNEDWYYQELMSNGFDHYRWRPLGCGSQVKINLDHVCFTADNTVKA